MTILTAWPRVIMATVVALGMAPSMSFTTMPVAAQSTNPTVPSMVPQAAAHTFYAKIMAIDLLTREVTMDAADGSTVTVIAAPGVPLENLEVGDRVDVNYYRSVRRERRRRAAREPTYRRSRRGF